MHFPDPRDDYVRPTVPTFATVGRPPPAGVAWSKGLVLVIAIGLLMAAVSLVWELQRPRAQSEGVQVILMEQDAEQAERALDAPPPPPTPASQTPP